MAKTAATKTPIVGLEIEPGYVSAAEVHVNGALTITRAATRMLAPGVVRDGEVTDAEALVSVLEDLFRGSGLGKRVRLGVASPRIVVRTLDLPPLADRGELAAAVRFQAAEQLPMPIEQAVLDFQPLGLVETPEGQRMRVVVVAARRDSITTLLDVARSAGLRPEGIDLSAFAMIRALRPLASGAEVVLYVNVGGLTNLAVAESSTCLFTRVAASGLEGMITALAERRALTLEHAQQWLFHVGVATPVSDLDGDPETIAEARSVVTDGVRRIGDDARNSLEFYGAQPDSRRVERAIVTGPGLAIPGLVEELAAQLGLPVDPGVVAEATPGATGGVEQARVTIAAGLAVAEVPA